MGLRVDELRKDVPLLAKKKPIIYFDNACMTLRPKPVIDAINQYYEEFPACAGRSIHSLSQKVDEAVYKARNTIKKFVNAKQDKEVIFLRNTTEGINLVANSFPFTRGDVILVSDKEHNSNLLPWQVVAKKKGLKLDVVNSNEDNTFSLDNFREKLSTYQGRVKMVAFGSTSNLDGVSIPTKAVVKAAHKAGSKVLFDAAQTAPHHELDVRATGADFVAFSGHKMLGPSGIGMLYGSEASLSHLNHYTVGGETIQDTTYYEATWEELPHRFEAGLQHYAGIIGLGAAASYLKKIGLKNIEKHEITLNKQLDEGIRSMPGATIIGPHDATQRGGITSFNLAGMEAHDVATMLSASKDIMIRSGAHCAHSWFNKHKLQGSARASLYLYNTEEEVATCVAELKEVAKLGKR
ncbi:cysteine desulfurase [Candidatus Woesearchaeota archaeon]|nr:cysteine desulfurase [Candidatus Woesearchaeota archaeon]